MVLETDGIIAEDFESNDDADRKRPEEVQM